MRAATMTSALVVGSGPNGLTAAAVLARAGVDVTVLEAADTIGGGTRSSEMISAGLLHDHCAAFHPVAAASPALADLDLGAHGLEWAAPPIDCVHPLDDGSAGVLHQSVVSTADDLGRDGRAWTGLFAGLVERFDDLFAEVSKPVVHLPAKPLLLGRFGAMAALPATTLVRRFKDPQAKALFMGAAAHALHRLDRPMGSAVGALIVVAGHRYGWVVAKGGSQSIARALASVVTSHGGRIETGVQVTSVADLPSHDLLLLDVSPGAAAALLADRLPDRVAKAYRRYRHGPGAFKVDFAVEGGVPWRNVAARSAGTVHLGGDAEEVAASELDIHRGRMPARPFVLVGQQYLADPSRSAGSLHPVWSYAHVPHGYDGDATEAIIAQIERFAPGVRDRIVGMEIRSTSQFAAYNPNFVGGDIIGGASTPAQLVFRPRIGLDPYATGVPGVWICSASTPPGAGAHGICGANAAHRALASLA